MKDDTKLEQVKEFYEFLQGIVPKSMKISPGHTPKLTQKKAFTVIWYLQEYLRIIPDNLEQCWNCGGLYDADCGGLYWEFKGRHYCDGCEHLVPENYDNNKRR